MFSDKLRNLMARENINQTELSNVTGISKSSISQYMGGSNKPKWANLRKMADALGVNEAELLETKETIQIDEGKNITVEEAAKTMGKSKQFVRVGLQRGILPFGSAVKLSSRWTYYISPARFNDYVGRC